jgi:GxxExxY protein
MKYFEPLSPEIENIATATVDGAYRIHKALGPGLLESVYESCLAYELRKRSFEVRTQLNLPITYDGINLESGLRPDILIADLVVVEVKAVEQIHPVHHAQVLTYLKLMNLRLGLLINFNVTMIGKGIKRIVL